MNHTIKHNTPNVGMQVIDLHKHFADVKAVNGLSLTAHQGEVLALLGPNGSGKTTFMRMLTGLLKPDSGRIELTKHRRHQLGYCPQRLIVWRDLTCLEQLIFVARMYKISKRAAGERAQRLLERFNLTAKSHALAANLSGGMQRRLSIAIAMMHDPDILVLDEPEAGLDPQSRILVRHILRNDAAAGKTVLVSSHDMEASERVADRVAIINAGSLLAVDTPEQLKAQHGTPQIIEIALPGLDPDAFKAALNFLSPLSSNAYPVDDRIILDADIDSALMRPVRAVLAQHHIVPTEIRLRQRTLEDVFISRTGRSLRP